MEQSPFLQIGLPVSLMIIMAGMGLTLTSADFRRVFVLPRAMLIGTVAQIVLIPALAFALAETMALEPAIAVGLVVIAACPGGATSNIFAFLAKANVALSITLTVIATLITIATIPLITNLALDMYVGGTQAGDAVRLPVAKTVVSMMVIIVLPVGIGMFIRSRSLEFAQKAEKYVSRFGLLVLVTLIAIIVYQTRTEILSLLTQAGPSCAALNIAGVSAGFLSGRLLGVNGEDALTIAIEVGVKNATIGLLVTLTLLASAGVPEATVMSIPSAVYGLLMYVFGGMLVAYGQRRARLKVPSWLAIRKS